MKTKPIVFTGGGSGGHVFPALAIIDYLADYQDRIVWFGSFKGIEREIISKRGLKYKAIPTGKFRRYFSLRNFTDIFLVFFGFLTSFFSFLFNRPALIFSKGGFVAVPVALAGALLRIPVYTHESDLNGGLATKIISYFADKIFISYEESKKYFKSQFQNKLIVSGNPIRKIFYQPRESQEQIKKRLNLEIDKPLLLILGGSLGAKEINDLIERNVDELCSLFFVVHQSGASYQPFSKEGYLCKPFFSDDYIDWLSLADVVVARAGAGTLWEISIMNKPALLIPYKQGRGDQVLNARFFDERNLAVNFSSSTEGFISIINRLKDDDLLKKNIEESFIHYYNGAEIISNTIREEIE